MFGIFKCSFSPVRQMQLSESLRNVWFPPCNNFQTFFLNFLSSIFFNYRLKRISRRTNATVWVFMQCLISSFCKSSCMEGLAVYNKPMKNWTSKVWGCVMVIILLYDDNHISIWWSWYHHVMITILLCDDHHITIKYKWPICS